MSFQVRRLLFSTGSVMLLTCVAAGESLFEIRDNQIVIPAAQSTSTPQTLLSLGTNDFEAPIYRLMEQAVFTRDAKTKGFTVPPEAGTVSLYMRGDPVEDLFPRLEISLEDIQGGRTEVLYRRFVESTAIQKYDLPLPAWSKGKSVRLVFRILNPMEQDSRITVYIRQIDIMR